MKATVDGKRYDTDKCEVLGTIEGVGEIRMLPAPTPDQVALDVTVNADELRDAIFFAMAMA